MRIRTAQNAMDTSQLVRAETDVLRDCVTAEPPAHLCRHERQSDQVTAERDSIPDGATDRASADSKLL